MSKLYPKFFDTKTIHQSVRLENVPESIAISPFPTNLHIITWPNCNKPTRWVAVLSNRLQFVWLKFVCCRELAASSGPELRTESRGKRVEPDERMEQDKKQLKCFFRRLCRIFSRASSQGAYCFDIMACFLPNLMDLLPIWLALVTRVTTSSPRIGAVSEGKNTRRRNI